MGTRNLTCVMMDGEYKVAQYGQWDGCPDGQGVTVLGFLREEGNIAKLRAAMPRVRFFDRKGRDKDFIQAYDENVPTDANKPDPRTKEQKRWYHTFISRDIGGKILQTIIDVDDEEILLRDDLNFAADSLFCEWAYVVDLDKNTMEVYEGFNKVPLEEGERFASLPLPLDRDPDYYQVRRIATWPLDALPTAEEFLAFFKEDEE